MEVLPYILFTVWFLTLAVAMTKLLLQRREPSSTIFWLCLLILFPIVGIVLFLLFGPQRLERAAMKRKETIRKEMLNEFFYSGVTQPSSSDSVPAMDPKAQVIVQHASKISEYAATSGNNVQILSDPELALNSMQEAIQTAKHFIHLEYYIIEADEVTQQLFQSLEVALDRGVEVRILYDALGSLFLKRRYFKNLEKKGAKVAGFLPIRSMFQRLNLNFRNHRKVLIVDGVLAFTGSANIGKNYLGKSFKNQWRDNVVRVEGPACLQLQDVFAKDWQFTTKEELHDQKYYPAPSKKGEAIVQVLESGPDTNFFNLHQSLFIAVTSARHEILLTTPYFIPDSAMETALVTSALRGIKVVLLVPQKSDSRIVQTASRSFHENILQSGAQIFEYKPKILHTKTMVVDSVWSILGSFNMDIRSFRLNFELNLLVYSKDVASQAASIMKSDLSHSHSVELEVFRSRSGLTRFSENVCRLLSPLL